MSTAATISTKNKKKYPLDKYPVAKKEYSKSPKPSYTYEAFSINELYDMMEKYRSLNPDPLHQRTSTVDSWDHTKNVGIIETIFNGFGLGLLVVRDITNESDLKQMYGSSCSYLVIDGGHRCRAIKNYMHNKFKVKVNGKEKFYRDLTREEKNFFLQTEIQTQIYVCTSQQCREIFLGINKMTKTNEIETIMADDINSVCRWIRERTWFYQEYDNREIIHPIFKVTTTEQQEHSTAYWNKPNTGGSFYYHAFITLAKARGRGNVDAGQKVWEQLVSDEVNIDTQTEQIWKKFFDDLMKYQNFANHDTRINDEIFGFFSCVWFELLSRYGVDGFKFDMDTFARELSIKRTQLAGKSTKNRPSPYDDIIIKDVSGKDEFLKTIIRTYVTAFAYKEKMSFAGRYILSELGDEPEHFGVIVMSPRKSISAKDRQYLLTQQRNRCYIDGKTLKMKDAHAAHIVALSMGGTNELSNLRMVRDEHNKNMGAMHLEAYKKYYLENLSEGKNSKIAA